MEKSEFLSFFYKHCMHVLTAPLFAATAENRLTRGEVQGFSSRAMSCTLLKVTALLEHRVQRSTKTISPTTSTSAFFQIDISGCY